MNPTLVQALVAYLHFISIFLMVVTLSAELILYRPTMTALQAKRLMLFDALYGLASISVVATGFARALWFAKDWTFYSTNPVFWAKVGLVITWGVLSIPPTIHYLSFRQQVAAGREIQVEPAVYKRTRLLVHAQLTIFPLVPLLAVLMARGFGLAS